MTLRHWIEHRLDPTDREHPIADADSAMHSLLVVCLWLIVWIIVVASVVWFFTLPTGNGEIAPAVGTTTTEGP